MRWPQNVEDPDTIDYKVGQIFSEIINKFRSFSSFRDALDIIDMLNFGSIKAKHELSDLQDTRIKKMGNTSRNGGEY